MNQKKLKEFAEIEDLDKFRGSGMVLLSTGTKAYSWFSRNKDDVLTSKDPYSIKIQKDYEMYKIMIREERSREKEASINYNKSVDKLYQEFIDIEDLDKFNYDSKIKFKNGMLVGKWFAKNAGLILFSKRPSCVKITEQYLKKKKIDDIKKRYINQRRKLEFIACNNIYKYDKYNSPLFKDGSRMSDWFYIEYPNIRKSKSNVDKMIKSGYSNYCLIYDLRLEFLDAPNEEKFEEIGIARFTTGAVMCLWWECYKEEILMSNNPIDISIAEQYLSYTTGTQKEVFIKK